MSSSTSNPDTPTIYLFGPLSVSLSRPSLDILRTAILASPQHAWVERVLTTLPEHYFKLCTEFPALHNAGGAKQVGDLAAWLKTGDLSLDAAQMPNTLLSPLVVIAQLVQYKTYLDSQIVTKGLPETEETVGFCMGLLSAFAVSLAHRSSPAEFERHAGAAVRLAMLAGVVVDKHDVADVNGPSTTLSVAWKRGDAGDKGKELDYILAKLPDTYISVAFDTTRVSIVTSLSNSAALQTILRNAGFSVTELGLSGRFHSHSAHGDKVQSFVDFCDKNSAFAFPTSAALTIPTRTNNGDALLDNKDALHKIALQSILLQKSEWYTTISDLQATHLSDSSSCLVSFGDRCLPSSLVSGLNGRIVNREDMVDAPAQPVRENPNDVAIIGVSINVAGASSAPEFWDLLASGKSQHKQVPGDRFGFETVFRETDANRKWYGNFIEGVEDFDHKFFKKTPRESAGMDPQQRLLMQCVYQAVEMSGYFNNSRTTEADGELAADLKNIGCYIGMCGNDYVTNTSHHAPNAFTATGTLRSFIAGKLSHYFGWLGPSLTLDTACSASAVAIHSACRAILSGECTAAIAGGTNTISEPGIFENLAGASFLSPTGPCKPFDAKADGYCRGEAISAVFLKSLAQARKDGDLVLGVIAGTAVLQNSNDTPIVVPNAPSLSTLFHSVLKTAKLDAQDVTVVEAHGTGTPVGDPAEYAAIRRIFGQEKDNGIKRAKPLQLGSVKGLIGHTEGSSGAVSLIKVLCMMHEASIPPQASHTVMNPSIGAKESDGIQISTQLKPWDADFKAVLINNYGASGSNASMVVTQPPSQRPRSINNASDVRYPFWISGLDDRSIRAYAIKLRDYLKQRPNIDIADLSFNVARQSNRTLNRALLFTARSIPDVVEKLSKFDSVATASVEIPAPRPVIMCFGGQMSTTINLDPALYESTTLLRQYMDSCNTIAISLGAGSIYPAVFQPTPIDDIVLLQTALFAVQYSTARCWLDGGVQPVSVVGHSFGELTAMCVSGTLDLEDAMKMIVSRATLVRDQWGPEKGSMVVIEASEDEILKVLDTVGPGHDTTIACLNAPRSHTVAGSIRSIEAVVETLSAKYPSMRFKRLAVSNAFHSSLVAPLRPELEEIGKGLTIRKPNIPFERLSKTATTTTEYSTSFVADHLENPVYFSNAVSRLAERYPAAIWLEAGSNATITSMAGKALGAPPGHHFQSINLTGPQGIQRLMDNTSALWKNGLRVTYWGHSRAQTEEYKSILLPPYQFEKKRHWLELKAPPKFEATVCDHDHTSVEKVELPDKLYTFTGYQDSKQSLARFRINTMIPKYDELIAGHTIAGAAPLCPATVQIDIAIEALRSLDKQLAADGMHPQVRNVVNLVPVCVDPSRSVWLEVEALDAKRTTWAWKWTSTGASGATPTTHVTAELQFRASNDAQYQSEFSRYERLVSHRRCVKVLHSEDADEVLQGQRRIYSVFSPIVDYSPLYFGLHKLVGQNSESAGRIIKKHSGDSWLDAFLADTFCQVAGIWVNSMMEENEKDMWIANGIEQWIRAPKTTSQPSATEKWHVFGQHSRSADGNSVLSDVFVFDAATGALAEVILGIKYAKVAKVSMRKLLNRLTADKAGANKAPIVDNIAPILMASAELPPPPPSPVRTAPTKVKKAPKAPKAAKTPKAAPKNAQAETIQKLKAILADLSGLEIEEIKDDVELGDIGVDSLMGMEMAREIEKGFTCTLPQDELVHVTNFPTLLRCLESALGGNLSAASSSASSDAGDDTDSVTTDATSVDGDADEADEAESKVDVLPFDLQLPQSTILKAFGESKLETDKLMKEFGAIGYLRTAAPEQDELCVALTVEAFKELGCDLSNTKAGQELTHIPHAKDQKKFAQYLYTMLETAGIVTLDDGVITRTKASVPMKASSDLLKSLLNKYPEHTACNELVYWTSSHLAGILTGREDGIKLIFGTERGRELVAGVYADFPLNKLYYAQMADFVRRLALSTPQRAGQGPLKILEMGAGTGGTTKQLLPMLASLGVHIEYTFTDLGSGFVAAARKAFKHHPFMKFRVHDIEKQPVDDLLNTQHVVIASNAVHATRSLPVSTGNIRKMLRPDGVLLLLEMTNPMYWCDMIFGVFEGWWLFEDGRNHAVAPPETWEKSLHSAGYGHVDWSDGHTEEVKLERLIMATAGGEQLARLPIAAIQNKDFNHDERRAATDKLIRESTSGFVIPTNSGAEVVRTQGRSVLITGATGSLGSHMVAHYANLPTVSTVVCLNRRSNSSTDALSRQLSSLSSRGLNLAPDALAKISAFEADTTKPYLGLAQSTYESLVNTITHIVHNAWPMNAKQPLVAFKPQFRVLRHFIDFAALISSRRSSGFKLGFQFISSIATVGHYPYHTGSANIPEERMTIESVLPNGYGDAKFICERMLDETLHQYASRFNTMIVRLGQVAGSTASGYWNENEHLPFLIKSSQTLGVLPSLYGPVSWTPVDAVAAACADLVLTDKVAQPVYHIDNPVRQPWAEMLPLLAAELGISERKIVAFEEWVRRVREAPSTATAGKDDANPAKRLVDFLEADFRRMSCGGVLLGTERSRQDSQAMRNVGPVDRATVRGFVQSWKARGFLA